MLTSCSSTKGGLQCSITYIFLLGRVKLKLLVTFPQFFLSSTLPGLPNSPTRIPAFCWLGCFRQFPFNFPPPAQTLPQASQP